MVNQIPFPLPFSPKPTALTFFGNKMEVVAWFFHRPVQLLQFLALSHRQFTQSESDRLAQKGILKKKDNYKLLVPSFLIAQLYLDMMTLTRSKKIAHYVEVLNPLRFGLCATGTIKADIFLV